MSITKTFYLFPRKLKEEAQCTPEGTREGLTRVYYRNGTLKKEVVYKNGKKDGIEKEYSRQGSMHCEISYHGGVRDGIYRCYTKGNLSREYTYKKGRKEGPARRLYKDGTRFEFECKDGREKVGTWRNYDQNGLLVLEKVYSRSNELLCELYYEYGEYGRIVTLQWTRFLDDEIEKYKQYAREYDAWGNPGFPVSERKRYHPVDATTLF